MVCYESCAVKSRRLRVLSFLLMCFSMFFAFNVDVIGRNSNIPITHRMNEFRKVVLKQVVKI